jgi:hypothetical protein
MTRKTHKATTRHHKKSATAFQTIPELRQSFDYIDEFVAHRIQSAVPKDQLVKELQREWLRVFSKRMEKKSATALIEHQLELAARKRRPLRRHTQRRHRGGVAPVADWTTQAGKYLASGLPPTANGTYPMANGSPSAYGSLTAYVSKGLMALPEQSITSQPIKGQSEFPSSATSPLLKGGARGRVPRSSHRRSKAAVAGGALPLVGSAFTQMAVRPIPSAAPPTPLQDAQTAWYGRGLGPSADHTQNPPNYHLGSSMFPKAVNVAIDTSLVTP